MFMKNVLKVSRKSFTIAALAFAFVGCGKQDSTTLQNPWANNPGYNYGGCPAGTLYVGGTCWNYYNSVTSGFTSSPCTTVQYSATQNELTCAVTAAYYMGSMGNLNIPYLPNATTTSEAWWGPELKAGDQVTLVGQVRYGSAYIGSLVGDCKDEQDASSIMVGAVGSSYFSLPLNQTIAAPGAGVLRIGMSARKNCAEFGGVQVVIRRNR